jgi:hypothetical protein
MAGIVGFVSNFLEIFFTHQSTTERVCSANTSCECRCTAANYTGTARRLERQRRKGALRFRDRILPGGGPSVFAEG